MEGEYLKVNALSYYTSLPSCYFQNKCILRDIHQIHNDSYFLFSLIYAT